MNDRFQCVQCDLQGEGPTFGSRLDYLRHLQEEHPRPRLFDPSFMRAVRFAQEQDEKVLELARDCSRPEFWSDNPLLDYGT